MHKHTLFLSDFSGHTSAFTDIARLKFRGTCTCTHLTHVWVGKINFYLAAQYKNVAIIIYNIEKIPALYVPIKYFFTHAWLPKDKFDEVVERNGWIFARKGEGYLALRSQNPYIWGTYRTETGDPKGFQKTLGSDSEIIVNGAQNIWLCQMGRKAEDGEFAEFAEKVSAAGVAFSGMNVEFQSPGNGAIRFRWEGGFSVDGVEIQLHNYAR